MDRVSDDESLLVNFDTIAYIKLEQDRASIFFSGAAEKTIDGSAFQEFRKCLQKAGFEHAKAMDEPGSGLRQREKF